MLKWVDRAYASTSLPAPPKPPLAPPSTAGRARSTSAGATFDTWPGPVDYLLRDDLLTQTMNKSYGYAELPTNMKGKKNVEEKAQVLVIMNKYGSERRYLSL
eukprot:7905994-Pyramimonas_sp.AAC.2